MSNIIDKNISKDLSNHLLKSIVLSFLLAILMFKFIIYFDSYLEDMFNKNYISSRYSGYIVSGIVEVVLVLLLILLYNKIKIQIIKRFVLLIILLFFIYINTIVSVFLISHIKLPIQPETTLLLYYVYLILFAYIMSLLAYVIYINYHGNSVCFNTQVAIKIKIKYVVVYILYGLIPIFVLAAIMLLILLFAWFKYYVLELY